MQSRIHAAGCAATEGAVVEYEYGHATTTRAMCVVSVQAVWLLTCSRSRICVCVCVCVSFCVVVVDPVLGDMCVGASPAHTRTNGQQRLIVSFISPLHSCPTATLCVSCVCWLVLIFVLSSAGSCASTTRFLIAIKSGLDWRMRHSRPIFDWSFVAWSCSLVLAMMCVPVDTLDDDDDDDDDEAYFHSFQTTTKYFCFTGLSNNNKNSNKLSSLFVRYSLLLFVFYTYHSIQFN